MEPTSDVQVPQWASALPQPKSSPPSISAEETANLIKTVKVGKDLIIVDTRRTDFEDYFIHGAINLPAHSFCQTLPGLVPLLSPVPLVIFHCNSCGKVTSRGRLVASWYQDALNEHGITTSKAKYLEGGIKGWIERYAQDPDLAVKLS